MYARKTYTSGFIPSSTLAHLHTDAPTTQCYILSLRLHPQQQEKIEHTWSASSGDSHTGVGCLLPTIKLI